MRAGQTAKTVVLVVVTDDVLALVVVHALVAVRVLAILLVQVWNGCDIV